MWNAQPGFPGLDTFLPALLTEARRRSVALETIMPLVTGNPARRMGLTNKGRLTPGADADITVVDLKATWTVDDAELATDAGYSTLRGQTMTAKVVHTLSRGRFALRDGSVTDASAGQGRYVRRKLH